jgi:hypothetical protein
MGDTTVVIAGHTPAGASPDVARRRAPVEESAAEAPMQVAPRYDERPAPYYAQQQQPYYGQPQPYYRQPQYYYVQQQPYYGQQQLYYAQPAYRPQYYVLRPYNPY